MNIRLTTKYIDENVILSFHKYSNNDRIAIRIFSRIGEPLAVATVNVPDAPLEEGHVFIKDWAENEGVLRGLVAAGIVEDTEEVVSTGSEFANVCKLVIPTPPVA